MLRSRALLLALASVLVITACTSGSGDASPAKKRAAKPQSAPEPLPGALGPEFFGMHDSDPIGESWPDGPVGALRVWDSGTVWSQMETAPGVYDFSRLDKIVETARKRDAQVLIVLGQTPTFHASKPRREGAYGPGASTMPDLDAWKAYVRAMAKRYSGPDIAFQVWNEANVEAYWSGTPRQMAKLTLATREVLDELPDPPLLLSPAMATRLISHRVYFRDFYAEKVGGRRVADLVDVLSFQLYPLHEEPVERSVELLEATRQLLKLQDVPDKPIWNTEINYGLQGGLTALPISDEEQAANVARTYVLNAAYDVERVYWYSWDLHTIANTDLVVESGNELTPAGNAFGQVQKWLVGTVPQGCTVTDEGTYVCTFQATEGMRRVYWNPLGEAEVRTAFDATTAEYVGEPTRVVPTGGSTLTVGTSPVVVASGHSLGTAIPPRS